MRPVVPRVATSALPLVLASVGWLPLAVSLGLSLAAPSWAYATGLGRIDGQVVNGTGAGGAPAGLSVTVRAFRDRTRVGEFAARTDETGRFRVEGLDVGPDWVYLPIVEYGGARYYPQRPITLEDASPGTAEVTVFESTDSDAAIAFERASLLVLAVNPTSLTIMEMGAVVNQADRTYVGAGPDIPAPTLRFVLPPGAREVVPQAGFPQGSIEGTPDGFVSTNPILPGRHELAFSYQVPSGGPSLDLTKRLPYPVSALNVYVPDTGLTATSSRLAAQGTAELGGQRYLLYSAPGLAGGEQVTLHLSGLPTTGIGLERIGVIVAGAGGIALLGALLVPLRRRTRGHASAPTEGVGGERPADCERLELARGLAELDRRYTDGEIQEAEYREERRAGKARLVGLLEGPRQPR